MGLLDKVKKAIGGTPPPAPKQGNQGGNRQGGQGGNRQGGQGGNRQGGQGGNRQGGNRQGGQGGDSGGEGSSSGNRRRGSRGGRGRGGQGAQGGDTQQADGQQQGGRQGGGNRQGGQGGNRQGGQGGGNRQGGRQGQGGGRQQNQGDGDGGERAEGTSGSSTRRRRRGGRGRGSGGSGGEGGENGSGQSGTTRKVTRSDASEMKEQGKTGGGNRSGNRSRSGGSGGGRKRSGGGNGGGQGGGRRRERTRRGSASSGSHRRVLDANERPKNPVKKQILINASDPNEIRVAIREQQKVVEVYVERKGKRSLAGNIYKGRVQNVLRGMEAAFVDIGLERNGFLYVDEVTPAAADSDQVMKVSMVTEVEAAVPAADGDASDATVPSATDAAAEAAEVEATEIMEPGTPAEAMAIAAATNDETLDIDDAMEEADADAAEEAAAAADGEPKAEKSKGRGRARIQNKKKIQDLLKNGQEILCQVVKDPMGTKGSRLTTQYSLAGRYLVYVPDGEGLGVSRRLEDAERNRLRDIVKQFELPWGGGLIVRTAAEGAREEDIAKDLDLLLRLHEQLMDKAGQARAPKLLYNEADLSLRIIRDLFNDEVEEVLVDDERHFQRIMNYLKRTSPQLAERVRMHDGQRPVFESYGVEDAIRSTLTKRAELVSGGYLIIDKTEAFHVIDVNTGRNVGTTASLEETITKTNMEAAEEVVRQLRLRDLGGIIVIDFIDMNLMKNRDMLLEHFRKELSKDRTKTYLVEISPLGLVEMTRQNVSEGVREILTSTCRTCEGRGVTVSAETHAIDVERAVVELTAGLDAELEAIAIEAQPDVAKVLAGNPGKQSELDKRAGKHVRVMIDPDLTPNSFAMRATGTTLEIDDMPDPLLRGTKHKVLIEKVDPLSEDDGIAIVDGVVVTVIGAGSFVGEEKTILIAASAGGRAFATLVKPARRRRRRGGRGRKRTTAAVGAGATGAELEDGEDLVDEDGDEFEDVEDDELEDEDEADAPDEAEDFSDDHSEIPQRLVMLEQDDPNAEESDEGDDDGSEADEDEDDDEDDEDEDDGSDHDDELDDDDDDDDDDDPSGSDPSSDEDDDSSSSSSEEDEHDENSSLDLISTTDGDEADDQPSLVGRVAPGTHDRDEPSVDVDGADDLLEARGVAVPKAAARPVLTGSAPQEGIAQSDGDGDGTGAAGGETELGPDGLPRRRRRRGSRGGRNRSRSGGGGGANRPAGGGQGGGNTSNAGGGSSSSSTSNDG